MSKKHIIIIVVIIVLCGIMGIAYRQSLLNDEIRNTYMRFRELLSEEDYVAAYNMMSDKYRSENDMERFKFYFPSGSLWGLQGRGEVRSVFFTGSLHPQEERLFSFWSGPDYHFIKKDGRWYLTGEMHYYSD